MFHRFYDNRNKPTGQGSFSPKKLKEYIESNGDDNFFKIEDLNNLSLRSEIPSNKILLTFDDGLFSQYESAKPILDNYGIKSIWFIYTKIFENNFDDNEILNYLICNYFSSFNSFYLIFKSLIPKYKINWNSIEFKNYCNDIDSKFSFYTLDDKKFRFIRNKVLSVKEFNDVVKKIALLKGIDFNSIAQKLWVNEKILKEISSSGHEIGLHSHTHPYDMKNLTYEEQLEEYSKNKSFLTRICGREPISVAYPLGSFNFDTLKVMKKLEIKIGFISSTNLVSKYKILDNKFLLLPRIDSYKIE